MLKKLLFISIVILTSCNSKNDITGQYVNVTPNKLDCFILGTTKYVKGSSLEINSDSTYKLVTCGVISIGKWSVKNNKLKLKAKSTRFKKDTIATPKYIDGFFNYKIKNGVLISKFNSIEGNNKVINKFIKN